MTDNNSSPKSRSSLSPSLPWRTRIALAFLSRITDTCLRSNGTFNRRLLNFIELRALPSCKPVRGVRTVDVTVNPSHDLWIRLFLPTAAPSSGRLPVIVFFHGGGFAFLSAASQAYDAVCRRISRKIPAVIVSVNYRLAPEHRCPAQYDDGMEVLRFLDGGGIDEKASDLADLTSCFLVGDSAGGNIAHHVTRRWAAEGGWERVRVAGVVAIQPYFGGEERTESEIRLAGAPLVSMDRTDWLWKAFLPEGADRDHEAANVFGPKAAADLEERFPPAMVVVAGYDPLGDWQRRYCEALRVRGKEVRLVEYPDTIHAFYVFPELKESGQVIEEMRGFIESHKSREVN